VTAAARNKNASAAEPGGVTLAGPDAVGPTRLSFVMLDLS
jgi:hypothetical protein